MNLKTRLWVIGTVMFSALLVLLGVMGGLVPQLTQAASTFSLVAQQDETNELQRLQLQQLQLAQNNVTDLNEQLEQLTQAIPGTIDSSALLAELDALQAQTGALVSFLKIENPLAASQPADSSDEAEPSGQAAQEIPISMKVTGSQEEVAQFIQALQTGDRLITYTRVGFGQSSGGATIANVYATIYSLHA